MPPSGRQNAENDICPERGAGETDGSQGGEICSDFPRDIYYFETVDNRVFVYLERDVYECKLKLYELEQRFMETDFFRATKSTIVNLSKVKSFSPAFNGRFELLMKNGEKLIVSRQYVPDLKMKLGL